MKRRTWIGGLLLLLLFLTQGFWDRPGLLRELDPALAGLVLAAPLAAGLWLLGALREVKSPISCLPALAAAGLFLLYGRAWKGGLPVAPQWPEGLGTQFTMLPLTEVFYAALCMLLGVCAASWVRHGPGRFSVREAAEWMAVILAAAAAQVFLKATMEVGVGASRAHPVLPYRLMVVTETALFALPLLAMLRRSRSAAVWLAALGGVWFALSLWYFYLGGMLVRGVGSLALLAGIRTSNTPVFLALLLAGIWGLTEKKDLAKEKARAG
jgi:hypothetical protein